MRQPHPQASLSYPSEQRRLKTEGDSPEPGSLEADYE